VIKSFAPGEIILFGEHSVVYGRKALAVSIEKGIETEFFSFDDIRVDSELGTLKASLGTDAALEVSEVSEPLKPFVNMIERCFSYAGLEKGFKAVIASGIPVSSGLASSASVSASFIAGLLAYLGRYIGKKELLDMVFSSEIDIQKRGSIIGPACAVYGGMVEVSEGVIKNHPLPGDLGDIVIINSKEKCSTAVTVDMVKSKLDEDPDGVQKIFDDMHRIACDGQKVIKEGDMSSLGILLNENQKYLKILGVSTKKIDKCISEIEPYVYGTKITGAGGGGCLFSLIRDTCSDKVRGIAENLGLDAFKAHFRGHGVEVNGERI